MIPKHLRCPRCGGSGVTYRVCFGEQTEQTCRTCKGLGVADEPQPAPTKEGTTDGRN